MNFPMEADIFVVTKCRLLSYYSVKPAALQRRNVILFIYVIHMSKKTYLQSKKDINL